MDPMTVFRAWMEGFRTELPVLMTLATVGPDGYPRTRNVMVSSWSDRICFHTDSRSEKAWHLADNPRVSATILAPDRSRQITVIGDAVPATGEENTRAYHERSRYLQILAWLNDDFQTLLPADERHRNWRAFSEAHPELEAPSTWAGYAVIPREFLFWEGDDEGPSQRTHFHIDNDTWTTEVLPG